MISPLKPIMVAIAMILRINAIRFSSSSWNRGGAARFFMPTYNVILTLVRICTIHDQRENFYLAWEFSHCSKIVENSSTKKRRTMFFKKNILEPHLRIACNMTDVGTNILLEYLKNTFYLLHILVYFTDKGKD